MTIKTRLGRPIGLCPWWKGNLLGNGFIYKTFCAFMEWFYWWYL